MQIPDELNNRRIVPIEFVLSVENGELYPIRSHGLAKRLELCKGFLGVFCLEKLVFISHADCPRDAELLAEELAASGIEVSLVTDVGPVIGSHSGPGTLALFFIGKER